MKKNKDKTNRWASTLTYLAATCFYIVAIINFISKDNSVGIIFLCLGSTFLCLGSVWLNNDKKNDKE